MEAGWVRVDAARAVRAAAAAIATARTRRCFRVEGAHKPVSVCELLRIESIGAGGGRRHRDGENAQAEALCQDPATDGPRGGRPKFVLKKVDFCFAWKGPEK